MSLPKGKLVMTSLKDGRVKLETGDLSGPLHDMADRMVQRIQELCGGSVEVEKVGHDHQHHHHHHDQHVQQ